MAEVLVTGGTGVLGRRVVAGLLREGHGVRILSRRARPLAPREVRAVWGDLTGSPSLREAVEGAEAIVHCASSPFRRTRAVDVGGTARLLEVARGAGVRHFLFVSIVGIDRNPLGYYRAKREAEALVERGVVPWTILRATQFHDLLFEGFRRMARFPVLLLPKGFRFQPVDAEEVADALVGLVRAGPSGRVSDLGGPEVREVADLARAWLAAAGRRRLLLPVALPGRVAGAFRSGANLSPDRAVGRVRWAEFLGRRLPAPSRRAVVGAAAPR
ncbi:MAG TPA: NAD(P)H-binding protein [Planctomycetota bacterium]|nr:NAD(P)H-binding protein [Planctomycetota bacterium]